MNRFAWIVVALVALVAVPAVAQEKKAPEPIAEEAAAVQEGEEGAEPEPTPEPTPSVRTFDCAVDSAGERCTVPISEGDTVVGSVAYQQEHTGEWVEFGWGSFNAEDQPHGCDWTLSFSERLVEERGCFEAGKRHGPWETCRLRIDPKAGGIAPSNPNQKCPKTEYDMGRIVVKAPEPIAEEAEEVQEGEEEGGDAEDGEPGEKAES